MTKSFVRSALFVLAVCVVYITIGWQITKISGGRKSGAAVAGINPEAGEAIFWGKGKCSTCHSLGDQGSAIRCPNLGVSSTGGRFTEDPARSLPIGARAAERAKERTSQTNQPYTAADYFAEDHFDPAAYIVRGFKNEMPVVWKPPIGLTPDEVLAVDSYLQAQGGEVDITALAGSRFFKALKAQAGTQATATPVAFQPYLQGDPDKGKQIFFDPESKAPCAKCHTVEGQGGHVGPELSHVAGTRTVQYIIDSVLDPAKDIAGGFEPYLLITNDGQQINGIKKGEDAEAVELLDAEGTVQRVPRASIKVLIDQSKLVLVKTKSGKRIIGEKKAEDANGITVLSVRDATLQQIPKAEIEQVEDRRLSIMPGNFRELLTVEEFHDLLAYLLTLQ